MLQSHSFINTKIERSDHSCQLQADITREIGSGRWQGKGILMVGGGGEGGGGEGGEGGGANLSKQHREHHNCFLLFDKDMMAMMIEELEVSCFLAPPPLIVTALLGLSPS